MVWKWPQRGKPKLSKSLNVCDGQSPTGMLWQVTWSPHPPPHRVLPDLQALLPAAAVPLRLRPERVPAGATLQKKEARGQRIEKWNNYGCDLDGGGGWWLYHYKYNLKAFSSPFVHSCPFPKWPAYKNKTF